MCDRSTRFTYLNNNQGDRFNQMATGQDLIRSLQKETERLALKNNGQLINKLKKNENLNTFFVLSHQTKRYLFYPNKMD